MLTKIWAICELEKFISHHNEEALKASDAVTKRYHLEAVQYWEGELIEEQNKTPLQRAKDHLKQAIAEFDRLGTLKQRNESNKLSEANMVVLFWRQSVIDIEKELDN